jgi:hypothetical protein
LAIGEDRIEQAAAGFVQQQGARAGEIVAVRGVIEVLVEPITRPRCGVGRQFGQVGGRQICLIST